MQFSLARVRWSTMGQLVSRLKHSDVSLSNDPSQPDQLIRTTTRSSSSDQPVQSSTNAGVQASSKRQQVSSSVKTATAVTRAIDERNAQKLKRALGRRGYRGWPKLTVLGVQLSSSLTSSGINHLQQTSSSAPPSDSSLSLLEYAVEKNFTEGVEILIKSISGLRLEHLSEKLISEVVTAAFLRSCDSSYLRLKIFNIFIESAINGRLQIDLHAAYVQLVDHYMYRKPFDLARKPYFKLISLPDNLCRITPLGLAVMHDEPTSIEQFLQRGADIDAYDREGNTALLRAGYALKRTCFIKLLSLGADPNRRSQRRKTEFHSTSAPPSTALPSAMSASPLIAVCTAFGHCSRTRRVLIEALIACGMNLSPDRAWIVSAFGILQSGSGSGLTQPNVGLYNGGPTRRIDEETRRNLFELSARPPTLQIQCCRAIRTQIARADVAGIEQKFDLLPLPALIKARLKLENFKKTK